MKTSLQKHQTLHAVHFFARRSFNHRLDAKRFSRHKQSAVSHWGGCRKSKQKGRRLTVDCRAKCFPGNGFLSPHFPG
jgi:hypothetical protein